MLKQQNKIFQIFGMSALLLVLSGCAGIRTPIYDGEPVEFNEKASSAYRNHLEIVGEDKERYLTETMSGSMSEPSLEFSAEASVLLESGQYKVVEDLPAGRVYIRGADSDFAIDKRNIHVGTITIRDESGQLYFETLFNDAAGIKDAYVDLREGHSIEIIGEKPEMTVSYEDILPSSANNVLIAGQYEVGEDIDQGTYEITTVIAPRTAVMYWFQGYEEPRVIELPVSAENQTTEELANEREQGFLNDTEYRLQVEALEQAEAQIPTITLETGDRLSIPMIQMLELTKVE